MARKKKVRRKAQRSKNGKKVLNLALVSGTGSFVAAALPGGSSTAGVRQGLTGGISKFSTVFPVVGKLKGKEFVFRATGRLIKTTRKLKGRKK